jgi:glycosyltransferase involved in cell wall biosynthesis
MALGRIFDLPRVGTRRRKEDMITLADGARDARQWELAAEFYKEALDRNPRNQPIWVQYGHALKESGKLRDLEKLAQAETAYRRALSLDSSAADTYLQLGHVLKLQGKREGAQAAYLRALALDPSMPYPQEELRGLGWSLDQLTELHRMLAAPPAAPTARKPGAAGGSAQARPVFSVLIPVHDRTWELREALDSVLSQSFLDFEIIIVTDATPAETLAIVHEYVDKDHRVRAFLYADNSGNACRGRNRGILEARGEFISLLDSDDLYFPNTLETVYRIFCEQPVDFVCGRAYFIVDGTRRVGDFVTGSTNEGGPINMDRFLRGENPIQTCTVHVRRDLLVKYGGFRVEQRYLEDLELWLRLAYHGCRFYYSDEILAKYRFHQGNLELKYIDQKDYWLEHMRNNYLRPFDNWAIGEATDRSTSFSDEVTKDAVPVWPGRVDAEWYRRQYPEIARVGADPLNHFIRCGRREGRKPNAAEARAEGWVSVTDVEISCLKQPMLVEEIALFVTHSPHGQLRPHVPHYLKCLKREGIAVVLIVAADEAFTVAETDLMNRVDGLFVRDNGGYDFAAWAHVLRLHPELTNANILYLLNDSVFGPVNDTAFSELLERIRNSNADFIGLTESFEQSWHLQSYFLAAKARAVSSIAFREFIEGIVCHADKDRVILQYELRFATIMKIAGLKCEAMFQKTDYRNPTIYHWRSLLDSGFPFLKIATVRDAPPEVDMDGWRQALLAQGYDVSLAQRTLQEIFASERRLPEEVVRQSQATHSQKLSLKILILFHELSESGAPRAAFDVACILRDAGHFVVVRSRTDGPYRQRLRNAGVAVLVDEQLFDQDRNVADFARNFDKVICNTINCWPVVGQLCAFAPIYWYVHESEIIHHLVRDIPGVLPALHSGGKFLVPSALPANVLAVYGLEASVIGYGVEDASEWLQAPGWSGGKVVIGVFGSYEPRKGQDLAVAGMLRVPEQLRKLAELRAFGRTLDAAFRRKIQQIAGDDPSIRFFEEVDHDECLRQMAACHIILVPSRDDPLPFVTLDALMLRKTLVCSSSTGTSAYLDEGRSGLILHQNTPEEIGSVLARLISNRQLREALGTAARQVYEQNFTVSLFKVKLFSVLEMADVFEKGTSIHLPQPSTKTAQSDWYRASRQ